MRAGSSTPTMMAVVESEVDAAALTAHAAALADGMEAAIGPWVEAAVARRSDDPALAAPAAAAAGRARAEVGAAVRELLALDVDAQATTPLTIVRSAVRHPTEVLAAAGVPPVARDPL